MKGGGGRGEHSYRREGQIGCIVVLMRALDLQICTRTQGKHGPTSLDLESLPLWDFYLRMWVNVCQISKYDKDHETRHGHMILASSLFDCCFVTRNLGSPHHRPLRFASATPGGDMDLSETTQILFNSPALNSLKRDQLVKLCKIHSIKASGKNVDIVKRLKDHAFTLPHGSPLSVAARSEQPQDNRGSVSSRLDSQRPSDQWELVMEDIPELPEGNSRATLSSHRSVAGNTPDEFGTGGGSKCQSSHLLLAQS